MDAVFALEVIVEIAWAYIHFSRNIRCRDVMLSQGVKEVAGGQKNAVTGFHWVAIAVRWRGLRA